VDFPHVGQVFWVRREVTHLKKNKQTTEIAYGITSLTPDEASPKRVLELNRMHWGIENSLHWVRDETFGEDRSQIRTGNAPRVMATLKNLVITILRRCGATSIAKAIRELSFSINRALTVIGL
jgi:predicted transposase YbfD/YdcC